MLAALDQLLTRELFKNTCLFSGERSLPFGLLVIYSQRPRSTVVVCLAQKLLEELK